MSPAVEAAVARSALLVGVLVFGPVAAGWAEERDIRGSADRKGVERSICDVEVTDRPFGPLGRGRGPRGPSGAPPPDTIRASAGQDPRPVYLVYYWRARPGRLAEYNAYIRDVAEPIDEEARKAGVFEEVRTYTPAIVTGAPGADWTHMRVFKLRSLAAWDGFSAGLDAATRKLYPDDRTRPRSDDLRDLVRQELWRELR